MESPQIAVVSSQPDITKCISGQCAYLKLLTGQLEKKYKVDFKYAFLKAPLKLPAFIRVKAYLRMIWKLKFMKQSADIYITDSLVQAFLKKQNSRHICIIHDYNTEGLSNLQRSWKKYITKRAIKRADVLVTVSNYWGIFFRNFGAKNVYTIHNAFYMYDFSAEELAEFRKNYFIPEGKPLIYIGLNKTQKGASKVYDELKDKGYTLVSSGKKTTNLPVISFEGTYLDYLKLLAVCDLSVLMSDYPEGWSRVAHESLLMKTPVIGNGIAGMHELLEGANQYICEDINLLSTKVTELMGNTEKMEELTQFGYNFAKKFTIENFEAKWEQIIHSL